MFHTRTNADTPPTRTGVSASSSSSIPKSPANDHLNWWRNAQIRALVEEPDEQNLNINSAGSPVTILKSKITAPLKQDVFFTIKDALNEVREIVSGQEVIKDPGLISERMNRRFIAALGLSDAVSSLIVAPAVGLFTQLITGSPMTGMLGTIGGDYIAGVTGFAVTWYLMNRKLYTSEKSIIKRTEDFISDTAPIFAKCGITSAVLYSLDLALAKAFIHFLPEISKFLPMAVIGTAFNQVFSEGLFLFASYALLTKHIKGKLSARALKAYQKFD